MKTAPFFMILAFLSSDDSFADRPLFSKKELEKVRYLKSFDYRKYTVDEELSNYSKAFFSGLVEQGRKFTKESSPKLKDFGIENGTQEIMIFNRLLKKTLEER